MHRSTEFRWALMSSLGIVLLLLGIGCESYQRESIPEVDGVEVRVGTDDFQEEVLAADVPVLVDFGAEWCGPCQEMEPLIAALSVEYQGRAKVAKVDHDESPELIAEYGIIGLPTFIIFHNGREIDRSVGGQPYGDLVRLLDETLEASPAAGS